MNPSILVVDDEKDIRDMLRIALMSRGYQVATANNGAEAIDAMRDTLPHAMILDLMMPRMTGYEVVDAMRDAGVLGDVAVIILTARDLDESDYQKLDGARAVLQKGAMDLTALVDDFDSVLAA